jgi:hypothetical protein
MATKAIYQLLPRSVVSRLRSVVASKQEGKDFFKEKAMTAVSPHINSGSFQP